MADANQSVARLNGNSINISATIKGKAGVEYQLSLAKTNMDTSAVPSSCISSLVNKRILENEANTSTMVVIDTTAYEVENLLMGLSEDASDRILYFQYGYNTNLSKIYRNIIYKYTPEITATTTTLTIDALSDEPRGTKATTSSSYGDGSNGGSVANRATGPLTSTLTYIFTLKQDSVMRGKESAYISVCNKYGIDPLLGAAINVQETGWYTSYACKYHNNIGGMMVNGQVMSFASLDKGIDAFAKNLKNLYYDEGRTTPETIGPKYCVPPENWIKAVRSLFDRFVSMYDNYNSGAGSRSRSGMGSTPVLGNSYISTQGINPTKISDIVKIICKRNGWKIGNIEETRRSVVQLTQYNISDIDFIKNKLRPLACSELTGEYGYVFYLDTVGGNTYANFHIPRVNEARSRSYSVSLDNNGGILSSKRTDDDYSTRSVINTMTTAPRLRSAASMYANHDNNKSNDTISKEKSSNTRTTALNEGVHIVDDKFNYGTNTSVVLSWKPQVQGAYLLASNRTSVEYSMLNETGDELKAEAVESAGEQYDNSRTILGESNTTTIKRSSSFSKIDSGDKAMSAWYNASKYMHLCTATIVGDHTISFGDTIDWNIFLQGKVHYTSGTYLVTEVVDTINSEGFTTALTMVKNAKNSGRIGQVDKSSYESTLEKAHEHGAMAWTEGEKKSGTGSPPSDIVKIVGNGLGNQIAVQSRSSIADDTTATQKAFYDLYGK